MVSVRIFNEETEKLIEGHRVPSIKDDSSLSLVYFMGNLSNFQVLTLELNPHLKWNFNKFSVFPWKSEIVIRGFFEELAPFYSD